MARGVDSERRKKRRMGNDHTIREGRPVEDNRIGKNLKKTPMWGGAGTVKRNPCVRAC